MSSKFASLYSLRKFSLNDVKPSGRCAITLLLYLNQLCMQMNTGISMNQVIWIFICSFLMHVTWQQGLVICTAYFIYRITWHARHCECESNAFVCDIDVIIIC